MQVHIATVEDTGTNEGERTLGVFLDLRDACAAIEAYNPWQEEEEEEDFKWTVVKAFDHDPPHESGATHVITYQLQTDSEWWWGHCVTYETR